MDSPSGDLGAPLAMVRSMRPLDGNLWEIEVRTAAGHVRRMVMSRDVASVGLVAMAAAVVAVLADNHRE